MNRISVAVRIERSRREIYDFAATPRTWRLWHPWFSGLSGITDRPLAVGEETIEQMRVAGRRVSVTWLLVERKAPERWIMEGRVPGKGRGRLSYWLKRTGKGTLCEREFTFSGANRLIDRLLVRPHLVAEAKESLTRLKLVLESAADSRIRQ